MRFIKKSYSTNLRRLRAFTLVEILIVIAIVMLLAALLFPVFGSIREKGRRTVCLSNLKQLGIVTSLYATYHNGTYPPVGTYPLTSDLHGCWANRIYPYVKSEKIFQCPSLEKGDFRLSGSPNAIISVDNDYWHYGSYVPNSLSPRGESFGIRQSYLNHPSDTVLLLDGDVGIPFIRLSGVTINNVDDLKNAGVIERHGRGDNVLMADGHVKWMKLEDMLQQKIWTARGN